MENPRVDKVQLIQRTSSPSLREHAVIHAKARRQVETCHKWTRAEAKDSYVRSSPLEYKDIWSPVF